MELGFAKVDITPRVGVELCGFGPFLNRHSTGVRDRLWARAMAVEAGESRAVLISCDLVGVTPDTTRKARDLVAESSGLGPDEVMICCSHTHSGPAPDAYIGWGEADPTYLAVLPHHIAAAAQRAIERLEPARLHHAEVPCEGIGLNREYEEFWAPYEDAMQPDWRPARPELTDTTCHVLTARADDGRLLGFAAYFGCHPVVCCSAVRMIHGDYPGVALNNVERDHPGAVGLFLQGALGDVNTAIGGQPERESLLALDEIAERFARSVRKGIAEGTEIEVPLLRSCRREVVFTRKSWTIEEIRRRLEESEAKIAAPDDGSFSDADRDRRLQMVYAIALRSLLARAERGETLSPATEVHGLRLGPVALLGSPFEMFQAIKNEVCEQAGAALPLVVCLVNDPVGYAPDKTAAARGGYAADQVPLMCGELPFANVHEELVKELLKLDSELGTP
jgi:hypothetical protein